jgi:hypothetical protein
LVLAHRKSGLTLTGGLKTTPSVDFPTLWSSSTPLADAIASPAYRFLARKSENRSQWPGIS